MFKKKEQRKRGRILGLYRFSTRPLVIAVYDSITDFYLRLQEQKLIHKQINTSRFLEYAKYAYISDDTRPLGEWTNVDPHSVQD